jgi:hypothetical protein
MASAEEGMGGVVRMGPRYRATAIRIKSADYLFESKGIADSVKR